MANIRLIPLLLLLALPALACNPLSSIAGRTIRGSGTVSDLSYPIESFSAINMAGLGEVQIQMGEMEGLRVEAEDNILPFLKVEVQDNTLTLGIQPNTYLVPTLPIRFYVTAKNLNKLTVSGVGGIQAPDIQSDSFSMVISGDGSMDVEDVHASSVKINISGSGNAELGAVYANDLQVEISGTGQLKIIGGEVAHQDVTVSGAGDYYARGLASDTATVNLPGAGSGTVQVNKTLDVTISGAGSLKYVGNPSLDQKVTGAGRIEHIGQ